MGKGSISNQHQSSEVLKISLICPMNKFQKIQPINKKQPLKLKNILLLFKISKIGKNKKSLKFLWTFCRFAYSNTHTKFQKTQPTNKGVGIKGKRYFSRISKIYFIKSYKKMQLSGSKNNWGPHWHLTGCQCGCLPAKVLRKLDSETKGPKLLDKSAKK